MIHKRLTLRTTCTQTLVRLSGTLSSDERWNSYWHSLEKLSSFSCLKSTKSPLKECFFQRGFEQPELSAVSVSVLIPSLIQPPVGAFIYLFFIFIFWLHVLLHHDEPFWTLFVVVFQFFQHALSRIHVSTSCFVVLLLPTPSCVPWATAACRHHIFIRAECVVVDQLILWPIFSVFVSD